MRIGCDLDGVVSNFVAGFRSRLISRGWATGDLPEPDRWAMWECWGFEREQWFALFEEAVADGMFHQLPPYEGAVEGLKQLKEAGHSIHIITHRTQPAAQTSTVGWLGEWEIPYDSLTFAKDKGGFPVDVMIEDNVDNARAVAAAGVPCYLMTRKWNEAEDYSTRVASWAEFVDKITLWEGNEPKAELPGVPVKADFPGEVRETSPTGGQKGQKPEQYSMIPVEALAEVARVYAFGAEKYDRDNWRRGYPWHNSYDALQRHANQFWSGETFDPESGYHHLAHAVFHCLTLITFGSDLERYSRFDDRQLPNPS